MGIQRWGRSSGWEDGGTGRKAESPQTEEPKLSSIWARMSSDHCPPHPVAAEAVCHGLGRALVSKTPCLNRLGIHIVTRRFATVGIEWLYCCSSWQILFSFSYLQVVSKIAQKLWWNEFSSDVIKDEWFCMGVTGWCVGFIIVTTNGRPWDWDAHGIMVFVIAMRSS